MDKVSRITEISQKIRDIEYAIIIFNRECNIIRGDGSKDIKGIIRIHRKTRVSLFGSRWFGLGTHVKEIELPSTIVDDIETLLIQRRNLLQNELDNLIK